VIKLRRINWLGTRHIWETKGCENLRERPKLAWEYNIKMDLQNVGWGMDLTDLAQDRDGPL
jgi:hypothetical protein